MAFNDIFSATNISASGLSAERYRMEVVANNVANAYSTRTPQGGPFRRKEVVFSAVLDDRLQSAATGRSARQPRIPGIERLGGVHVDGIVDDPSELPRVYTPGHPDADRQGFVTMPNVQLPIEMVNLITANRSYEANLKVLQAFRQQAELALLLLRL